MEIRKEMPEEVKNQKVDGKPRVITEKIPEKQLNKIVEKVGLKNKLLNGLLSITVRILNAEEEQRSIQKRLKDNEQSISDRIKDAYRKMKLVKRSDYQWQFDGRDSFRGIYNPPKPKQK